MYKQQESDERGAVSMLTVIFVAIILTVVTTSFVRLSVNEQRESIDDDLTTRAYYAAESGVQDAITAIKNDSPSTPLLNSDECLPHGGLGSGVLSSDPALDVEYTCQLIDLSPNNLVASLGANQSELYELRSSAQIDSFILSWHIQGIDSVGQPTLRASSDTDLPTSTNWNTSEHPAMIRLQIITVPTNDSDVQRDEIGNLVTFLDPVDTPTASQNIAAGAAINGNLIDASCNETVPSNEYVCSYSITGLDDPNNNYFLKVTSIYRPANIRIEAYSGGTLLELIGAQAAIDVTGRAGDVFRRVEERVDLTPDSPWPDYAIFSAEDICKNFVITDTANDDPANPGATLDFSDVNAGISGSCL